MDAPESRYWQPRQLDAGDFQPEISSFRLHLAAEGKAAKTVDIPGGPGFLSVACRQQQRSTAMSQQENLRIVREVYDAVGRGDVPAILDRVTDDVDWSAEADSHAAPWYGARVGKAGVASFFSDLAGSIEITEFAPHSLAAGQDDVHLLVRWTFRSITTGQQASMTMHHYWRIRDGKIEHFRGSEDTEQTARILTPDLTPAPNP